MDFLESIEKQILKDYNTSITENGAIGYETTGKEILDMNFKLSSYRSLSEQEIINDYLKVFLNNKKLAVKFLFFIRDREDGAGERRLFRVILKYLAKNYPNYVVSIIPLVQEYGRFDDLLCLFDIDNVKDVVFEYLRNTLNQDFKLMEENKPISLLAKWMPSINTSSNETVRLAKEFINYVQKANPNYNQKQYRKNLAKLRTHIDVVEVKMCSNNWGKIDYEKVPSRANIKYRSAFLRHDEERRSEFLDKLSSGEVKINSSKLFPYEIYNRASNSNLSDKDCKFLNGLWDNLPDTVGEEHSILTVVDGSYSMKTRLSDKSEATALDVSRSLGLYFAERIKGKFHNNFIAFSSKPKLVNVSFGETFIDRVRVVNNENDYCSTNIYKVFELILNAAINRDMTQEDLPSTVLMLSDMEFDDDGINCGKSLFDKIKKRFEEKGYKLPKLVFWNICSRTNTIPILENDMGIALVSGFSTSIFDMVISNKLDPLESLLEKLNSERYYKVEEALNNI